MNFFLQCFRSKTSQREYSNFYTLILVLMAVFFWDPSQDMSSSTRCLIGWCPSIVYQLEAWFLAGHSLNLCPDSGFQKKTVFSLVAYLIAKKHIL